ncbi:MAG: T9SS type A sorting domain-containing protein [Bacteroidetes bacterium]|nr:T9SS type A sorting domain-containing protein [Bacteroidota bacterium]
MKKNYLLLLSFVSLFITTYSLQAQPAPHAGCHHYKNKIKLTPLTAKEKSFLNASNGRSDTIDILNYNITLDVTDFGGQTISGACEIQFTPKMNDVDHIPLDLLLEVDSVYGAVGNTLSFDYDGFVCNVLLNESLNTGDTSKITIYYQGHPVADPSGFGGLVFQDGIAYNLGIGLSSNPYNFGRSWFPCFDNFVERSTYDLNIISNGNRRAYCIGTFLEETALEDDRILRKYRMTQSLPTYLVGVAVGNFGVAHDTHEGYYGDIPVELIAKPADTTSMKNTFTELGNAIDALESWYGPYQWERVGYVLTRAGAMEHATCIAYPRNVGIEGATPNHNRLMAHELAHHWWGNITTLSSPANMWIKEGNAEYGAHLFTEYAFGKQYFIDVVKTNHKEVLDDAHIEDGAYLPLSGIPYENTYGTHTYYKGASVMHNLRGYLGDSLFSSGMTSILNTFPFEAVDAEEFRDHLSSETGIDLTSFFEDWIYSPGYSDFEINSVTATPEGNDFLVNVEVQQKLLAAPHFHTNVPLEITFFDNNWNAHTEIFSASGEYSNSQYTIPFEPHMQVLNVANKLNLARTQSLVEVRNTGNISTEYSGISQFKVLELQDSALINMVHHRTAADPAPDNDNIFQISSTHYWSIRGILPPEFDAKITIQYNGILPTSFDYDLVSETEEDLILLWRPSTEVEWQEYPDYQKITLGSSTDGSGFIRIEPVQLGDYALANGNFSVPTSEQPSIPKLTVFPNPTNGDLFVEGKFSNEQNIRIEIYDILGKILLKRPVQNPGYFSEYFNLFKIPSGNYMVRLVSETGKTLAQEKVSFIKE